MDENNVIGDDGLEYVEDNGLEYVEEEEYYEDDEGGTGLEVVEDDGIEYVEDDEVVYVKESDEDDFHPGAYEGDFDGDELSDSQIESAKESRDADTLISNSLQLDKDNFNLSAAVINISDIVIPTPVKDSRKETYIGLTKSVEEFGILTPIHVMVTEGYSEHLLENGANVEYDGPKYALLDGLRRLFAGKKNGLNRVNAIIWDFNDKDKGAEMQNIISLILNKAQKKSWSETWYMYQILEEQSSLTPGTIEYLLQLEPGDATKLKEIMTRADEFPQPKEDLLSKKKTLVQAFNALNKEMKEQNQLYQEDIKGMGEVEQAEGVINEGSDEDIKLSDEEVKEILDMEDSFEGELSEDDFDELMSNDEPERQKVGERHPIDPALKAETLVRDGYKCTCCDDGEHLPMRYKMSILQSHHKISVANGGPDTAENITTLCVTCHTLVHSLIWSGLKFGMSKEEFDALPTDEQDRLKNVMRLARTDYEAAKRLGKEGVDRLSKSIKKSTFKMPGTDMIQNANALKEYGSKE